MYNPMQTTKGDRIRILGFHRVWGRKHILQATSQGPILGQLDAHEALEKYQGGILSLDNIRQEANTQKRCYNECCKHYCELLNFRLLLTITPMTYY